MSVTVSKLSRLPKYPEIGVDVLDSSKDSKLVDLSGTLEIVKVVSGFFESL